MKRLNSPFSIATVLLISFGIQLYLMPTVLRGADTRKFLEIAEKQMLAGFWTDPSAFDGNYWSVGYPTFISMIQRLPFGSVQTVQIIQIVMATLLALFAWILAANQKVIIRYIVLLLVAFSPEIWWMGQNGGYEILLSFLLVGSLLVPYRLYVNRRNTQVHAKQLIAICLSGFFFGCAVLVQSKAIVLGIVLIWLSYKVTKQAAICMFAGLGLALGPWMIRNFIVIGSASPFNTNGPVNFWIANNPTATDGGFLYPPSGKTDFLASGFRFLIEQPEAAVSFLMRRAMRLLEPVYLYPENELSGPPLVFLHYVSALIFLLCVLGFFIYLGGRCWVGPPTLPSVGPLAVFVFAFYLVHLPFLAEPRFIAVVVPVMFVVSVSSSYALINSKGREILSKRLRRTEARSSQETF